MSAEALSVAVVGAGMAGRSHANGYRQAATVFGPDLPHVRLAVVADVNLRLAQDTARRYGYDGAVADWQSIAADDSIDVVSVVVGNALHREVVEGLLAAGKHVLCEKPLAGNLDDAEAMVSAAAHAAAAGLVTGVGYSYRRTPAFAGLAGRVAAGELGTLSQLDGRYWCDYSCDPAAPMTWRYRGIGGTGVLGDLGSHTIDIAELLCGPVRVVSGAQVGTVVTRRPLPLEATVGHRSGAVSTEEATVENEDTAVFTARFANGAAGTFSFSRVSAGFSNGQQLTISGTGGWAAMDWQRPAEYSFNGHAVLTGPDFPYYGGGLPTDAPGLSYGYSDLFTWQARAFLDQVAAVSKSRKTPGPLPPCASFAEGLHTLRVIDAVATSARKGGTPVPVEPADEATPSLREVV